MNIPLLFRQLAFYSAITAAFLGLGVMFASGWKNAIALLINVPFGYAALLFLAKDVEKIFLEHQGKFFILKFIFRLACFAILLYLMLVLFRFNPLIVITGLMLPLLMMMVVFIRQPYGGDKDQTV